MKKTKKSSELDAIPNVKDEGCATVAGAPDIPSDFLNQCLDANEKGDGLLFQYLHQRQCLYVAESGEWYIWGKHYWQRDWQQLAEDAVENVALAYLQEVHKLGMKIKEAEKADEQDRAKKLRDRRKLFIRRVERLRTVRGVKACLQFARQGERGLVVSADQMDNKPWLLACANGVIDLKNGKLRPGRPEDYLSLASPFPYLGSKHTDPIIDCFMLDIFNNRQDVVDYMQKVYGYSITGLSKYHEFYCCFGECGFNGKGLVTETISETIGPLAAPIQSELLLEQKYSRSAAAPSPEIMKLKGLRFVYASETDEGRKFSSSKVKWLAGGDTLTGRWPNDKRNIDFKPTHTLFLLTNHKPRVDPADNAFWERMRLIVFEVSFITNRKPDPEKNERQADIELPAKLSAAGSAMLSWLVRGCLEWQRDGHLKPPPYVIEATAEYRRKEDLIQEWLDMCCSREPEGRITAAEAYDSFELWYNENIGRKTPSQKFFGKQFGRFADRKKGYKGVYYLGWSIHN